jgi:hypothetical protein
LNLLTLALADNALFGFDSVDEVFEQRIPDGDDELPLRWREDALQRSIIRNATADGVSEDPLTQYQFNSLFHKVMKKASYTKTATIHALRRELGKVVNSRFFSLKACECWLSPP